MRLTQTFQLYNDEAFSPANSRVEVVTAVLPGLGTDRPTLPADGATAATCHYAHATAGAHVWTITRPGATTTVTAPTPTLDAASGLRWSELPITADEPGPITVTCAVQGAPATADTLTLEAL